MKSSLILLILSLLTLNAESAPRRDWGQMSPAQINAEIHSLYARCAAYTGGHAECSKIASEEHKVYNYFTRSDAELLTMKCQEISCAANHFGIAIEPMIGAIGAELAYNTDWEDMIQNLVARGGIPLPSAVSVGFGQVNGKGASATQNFFSQHYPGVYFPRNADASSTLARKLAREETNIFYVAAVIAHAQFAYKNAGCDISQRPDILVSLYNSGGIDNRASLAAARRARNQTCDLHGNWFGFFVQDNRQKIAAIAHSCRPVSRASCQGYIQEVYRQITK